MQQAQSGEPALNRDTPREQATSFVVLNIRFMGVIASFTGGQHLKLDFDRNRTLRDLLTDLEARYGPEFGARIFRCAATPRRLQMGLRLFINKQLIEEAALDRPLPLPDEGAESPEILVYFLPAACGG